MKLNKVCLKNFRRLENVEIDIELEETVFVGPNNSGKTSATAAFKLFLAQSEFKVHDFSVSKIILLDKFGAGDDAVDAKNFPVIEMDLWFSLSSDMEFGRAFSLITNASEDLSEVGIRIKFCVKDLEKLKSEYLEVFPRQEEGESKKPLTHYLSLPGNLTRHFGLAYFSLEKSETEEEDIPTPLKPEEGRREIKSLLRVDFVNAQRNIDDQEESRSSKLSAAFATFYKKNLEQAEVNDEANRIIDENNQSLTEHYEKHFEGLMEVIADLGVPAVNDRRLRVISSLSPEVALQGNTSLLYVDPALNHELPEAYNGLGFKNLVYMAIQISHYHTQWMNTAVNRPLSQIIFIEEPEVHLHAQVQQTFISNIWKIIQKASISAGEKNMVPQLAISTHSSHIIEAVEFSKVRYFKRCTLEGEDPTTVSTLNASKILSLRDFKPNKKSAAGVDEDESETLKFLKRYLKLTHCDLFFADATILVEGTVEKLLSSEMIEKTAPKLKNKYITILEVGGAYASRFASLLEYLGVPYLVITDLDSVDPADGKTACRADVAGARTSNSSLKFFFNKTAISELISFKPEEHILYNGCCYVAFQKPIKVKGYSDEKELNARTFEEAFVYQNAQKFRDGNFEIGIDFTSITDINDEYQKVYERIKSASFKKTEFALDVASSEFDWVVPDYIKKGLVWLESNVRIIQENQIGDTAIEVLAKQT